MPTYENKQALIDEIVRTYHLLDQEFDAVPKDRECYRVEEVDRTPHEMLAYQVGWLTLLLSWERDELAGLEVITPSPLYKWNQLGLLYAHFYDTYAGSSLHELRALLQQRVLEVCQWIEQLEDEELFSPGTRKWAATSANWPICKWIHINSVAPFKSFRTKIRKWKKIVCV
ncbi:ClbS/DfsB family four-helix bundle protein [Paenibacillus ihbetae]|uniref:Cytoplasmic protein n=1 Tax=Paenibacillus ihbetae TaxID=1870820 RepID=A0A1B2E5G6_9BACL|nr:ClbS/DfsB family four-helix bundle protein [Paenibacillus ihbetae]ANY75203.1 hypothetical protein BBD41_22980 [Paenibacillus ihbetae]OOC62621.1 hypothetical protein BBD40_12560 [Paenibacillus ihbetae]